MTANELISYVVLVSERQEGETQFPPMEKLKRGQTHSARNRCVGSDPFLIFGGGGGIRTRVPEYQIKSLYMFIPLFNLPDGASADGISAGQPFEASSNTLKANGNQTILLATSLQPRRLNRKTGCSI